MKDSRYDPSPRALAAAAEIFDAWHADPDRWALDRTLAAGYRERKFLNSGERRWIGLVLFGTVRFLTRQKWLVDHAGLDSATPTLLSLWSRLPAAGDGSLPDTAREALAASESDEDKRLLAAADELDGLTSREERLRVHLSFPEPLAAELLAIFGTDALEAAAAFNEQAPVVLRANLMRGRRGQLLAAIPGSVPSPLSPLGIRLPGRVNVRELPGFHQGRFEVQEEASQLVSLLIAPKPGQTMVEVGAGGGGKCLAVASIMQNRGRLFAIDSDARRLEAVRERAGRARAGIVSMLLAEATPEGWNAEPAELARLEALRRSAESVLVDAPCTGTGTLRRNPDIKWRHSDAAETCAVQRMLLRRAADMVKPAGLLCYATCAFERSQNDDIVEDFLQTEEGADFEIEPAAEKLLASCSALAGAFKADIDRIADAGLFDGPYLRTWPHRHDLDAFFAALLRRKPTQ